MTQLTCAVETLPVIRRVSEVLLANHKSPKSVHMNYVWPSDKELKAGLQDNPELRLVAVLILTVKLCFPFEGEPQFDKQLPALDWDAWTKAMSSAADSLKEEAAAKHYSRVTSGELLAMTPEQFDDYFAKASRDIENRGMIVA